MSNGVIITLIVCTTLVLITLIGKFGGNKR